MRIITTRLLVFVLLLGAFASTGLAQFKPVKVYVFTATDPGGFIDADSKQRSDSVKDIVKQLRNKDREVALVDHAADADLILEVMGRGWEDNGSTSVSRSQYGTTTATKDRGVTVYTRLAVGEYATGIKGYYYDELMIRPWTMAAASVANQVVRWIKDNDARVPRK